MNFPFKPNYILASTKNGLFLINSKKEKQRIDENEYHTLLLYDSDNIILSNNYGLFILNLNSYEINNLISNKEFNKGALHNDKGKLLAGSVNGVYLIDPIKKLNGRNNKNIEKGFSKAIVAVVILLFFITVVVILITIKKGEKNIVESPKITKKDIEFFIETNLHRTSLNLICEHFNISVRSLYSIVKPEKPGDLIKQKREQKVKELLQENKYKLTEIASKTGYSLAYLRNNRKRFVTTKKS